MKVKEKRDFVNTISDSCEIVDSFMVRGLSMDRAENKAPREYRKSMEHKDVGLVTYTPKNLTEMNEDFIDPVKNKTIYENYDKMVLRVLLRIRTPLHLNVE